MSSRTPRAVENWGSRLGVILAVAGSAVGLGNFLRFPGQAVQNGGGSFLIPYFVCFVLVGLPIAWVEWSMGRRGGRYGFNSAIGIYRSLWPRSGGLAVGGGLVATLIPVVIYMYYVYIEAWCLAYALFFWTGSMPTGGAEATGAFFGSFTGMGSDGSVFGSGSSGDGAGSGPQAWSGVLPFLVVCFVLNFLLISRGLTKGIEWFCRWAMPALVLAAIVVLIRVLTLGTPDPVDHPERNISTALGFMWNPTQGDESLLETLLTPSVWMAAAGQIFFSLSVGFGIVLTYASYLRKDDDVALSSMSAAAGNGFAEVVLGGLITVPAIFLFLGSSGIGGTFGNGFVALPAVFAEMPLGSFFGGLFFFLLFLAAVTSSLSMLQPAIAFLEEGLDLGRRASVAILGMLTLMGALFVAWFSENLAALDYLDFWVGTFCIFVLAMFQVILFGWVVGIDKGMDEVNQGAAIRLPRGLGFIIKYVSPVLLISIFIGFIYQMAVGDKVSYVAALFGGTADNGEAIPVNPVAWYAIGLIVVVLAFFGVLAQVALKRWRSAEAAEEV